jgi:hypothetical protein
LCPVLQDQQEPRGLRAQRPRSPVPQEQLVLLAHRVFRVSLAPQEPRVRRDRREYKAQLVPRELPVPPELQGRPRACQALLERLDLLVPRELLAHKG